MNKVVELNPELFELAKKSKEERGTTFNIKGTTVNYVMCDLENRTLITAFNYLTESKGPVSQLVNAKDSISRQCTSILKGRYTCLNCHYNRFRNVQKLASFSLVCDLRGFRRRKVM